MVLSQILISSIKLTGIEVALYAYLGASDKVECDTNIQYRCGCMCNHPRVGPMIGGGGVLPQHFSYLD